MPNVTAHVNKLLTNISVDFSNEGNWLANLVAPPIKVNHNSDSYLVFDSTFRTSMDERANGGEANVVTRNATTATYFAPKYGNKDFITDDDMQNADDAAGLEAAVAMGVAENIMNRKEQRFADFLYTTTTFSNNATISATWNDYTADVADPVAAINTAIITVQKNSGRKANVCIVGRDTLSHLKNNYRISDRIKYTSKGVVTADLLSAMFEIPKVYIGEHVQDATNEATAASGSYTHADNVFVGYVAPAPQKRMPSAIYQFSPYGGMKTKKYYDNKIEATVIETNDRYTFKAAATGAGYFIKDTDASG